MSTGQVVYVLADRQTPESRLDLLEACSQAARLGCTDALGWKSYVEGRLG
jgi:hypothetical protein